MNFYLLSACIFVLMCVLVYASYRIGQKRTKPKVNARPVTLARNINIVPETDESGIELALVDECGGIILQSREIRKIPAHAQRLKVSSKNLQRVQHLASDLFKGASGIPNKTIELVFKQHIQEGLVDGTYTLMKTESGEVLADAVNSSNKIVGKGRVIQSGKARQLASGALQLVSIAVAQSHLADIERTLDSIKSSIAELLSKQENEDKANISGAIDYLEEIAEHMKQLHTPDELSQQKRNVIEGLIRDSYIWRNKLHEDLSSLIGHVTNIKSSDTFGTGETYSTISEQVEKLSPLLKRHALLLQMANLTNYVTAYLDPMQRNYSKILLENGAWSKLVEKFKDVITEKTAEHLSSALFNSREILTLRKAKIQSSVNEKAKLAIEQQNSYELSMHNLSQNISRLIDSDGNVRIAMTFDNNGQVEAAAITG